MYTREFQTPRSSPVENGFPLSGTWKDAFSQIDLMEIHHPYNIPLPKWFLRSRIRQWQSFFMQDERFFLHALLFDARLFSIIQIVLYDKKAAPKEKRLHKIRRLLLGDRKLQLPKSLANAYVDSKSGNLSFRIHEWLDAKNIRMDLSVESLFTAHLKYMLPRQQVTPLVVSLLFSQRRSMTVYKAMSELRGDVSYKGAYYSLDPKKASGIFCDYKGLFPYTMSGAWATSMGFDESGKRIGFSLADTQTKEAYSNNENALWIDGTLCPLPPVRITRSEATGNIWVIQDTEGMVDLTFSEEETLKDSFHALFVDAVYYSPLGFFNGMLINSKEERFPIRKMWGICELLSLRV
jgi:hypothetical protein